MVCDALGSDAADAKKRADARKWHEKSLAIREATLPAGHLDLAIARHNLGNALQARGHVEESATLHLQSLKQFEANLGPEHPYVGYALESGVDALVACGRLDEAKPLASRLLLMREATLEDADARAEARELVRLAAGASPIRTSPSVPQVGDDDAKREAHARWAKLKKTAASTPEATADERAPESGRRELKQEHRRGRSVELFVLSQWWSALRPSRPWLATRIVATLASDANRRRSRLLRQFGAVGADCELACALVDLGSAFGEGICSTEAGRDDHGAFAVHIAPLAAGHREVLTHLLADAALAYGGHALGEAFDEGPGGRHDDGPGAGDEAIAIFLDDARVVFDEVVGDVVEHGGLGQLAAAAIDEDPAVLGGDHSCNLVDEGHHRRILRRDDDRATGGPKAKQLTVALEALRWRSRYRRGNTTSFNRARLGLHRRAGCCVDLRTVGGFRRCLLRLGVGRLALLALLFHGVGSGRQQSTGADRLWGRVVRPLQGVEHEVFVNGEVEMVLAGFTLIKIDVTSPSEEQSAMQKALHAETLPSVVIYRDPAALRDSLEDLRAGRPIAEPSVHVSRAISAREFLDLVR